MAEFLLLTVFSVSAPSGVSTATILPRSIANLGGLSNQLGFWDEVLLFLRLSNGDLRNLHHALKISNLNNRIKASTPTKAITYKTATAIDCGRISFWMSGRHLSVLCCWRMQSTHGITLDVSSKVLVVYASTLNMKIIHTNAMTKMAKATIANERHCSSRTCLSRRTAVQACRLLDADLTEFVALLPEGGARPCIAAVKYTLAQYTNVATWISKANAPNPIIQPQYVDVLPILTWQ